MSDTLIGPMMAATKLPPQLEHVVVMGGASCTGKSTLATRLLARELPRLAATLGLESGADYQLLYGRDWHPAKAKTAPHLFIQYDLTAQTPFATLGELDRSAISALGGARRVSIATVWESPDELQRRLTLRFDERGGLTAFIARRLMKGKISESWRSIQRFRQRRRLFTQSDDLWQLYQRWIASCEQLRGAEHWVVRSIAPETPTRVTPPPPDAPFWR